jgi:glycine oxidase
MNDLRGLRVVVAGAGAVGSVTALTLLRCGADVVLTDCALRGDNASGVAAGMLAPVFESLLDPVADDHFPLLAVARDFWTGLLDTLPAGETLIDRSGALYLAIDDEDMRWRAERIAAFDPGREILSPAVARGLCPGLTADRPALFSALDWRLEPGATLLALQEAFLGEGGRLAHQGVTGWSDRQAMLSSGEALAAEVLVLATGAAVVPVAGLREYAQLSPIKGQILRFGGAAPLAGPVVRAEGVYVVPSAGGAVVGATMQAGLNDRRIEPDAVAALQLSASLLFAGLAQAIPTAFAGVRASTPDGLPMVGFSRGQSGLMLAVGARRNGWLLAPAMADVVAGHLRGLETGAFGQAFDPGRFAHR